ncbi:hypothetical protein QBC35DRAFT_452229 [Podospora australis]|uniref:Ecp2 effector protein domain-containing protein n=1 Tax=Podospora australis TaxID=1536484 RepID=A0AAN7AG79_9PEZI|nr:hypothetical protein QBC35DRAFT_452229 [Podospora australis]
MKLKPLNLTLIALLFTGAETAPSPAAEQALPSPPKDLMPKKEWPKMHAEAAYNYVPVNRLKDAAQCLANWCDRGGAAVRGDRTHHLWPGGGWGGCWTDEMEGENAIVFVCNLDGNVAQRCTATGLYKALAFLGEDSIKQGANDTLKWTGRVHDRKSPRHHLVYGFDRYCAGSTQCGGLYDPAEYCHQLFKHAPPVAQHWEKVGTHIGNEKIPEDQLYDDE